MAKRNERRERRRTSARQRAEDHKTGFEMTSLKLPEGTTFFKVEKEGVYRLDIVPYVCRNGKDKAGGNPFGITGEDHFERTYYTHRGIGINQDTYVCPRKTAGLACPVCEDRTRMSKEADADDALIKDLLPKERQLWNVFDHDNADDGVQIWDMSYHLFGKQLDARVNDSDEEDEYEFFADREDGSTLKIGFGEKTFGSFKFFEARSIDFKKRVSPLSDELLASAVNLDEALIILPYEELKAIYFQTEATDDGSGGDDKDNGAPADKERKQSRQSKPKPVTAKDCGIDLQDVVQHEEFGKCTVLRISGDGTSLVLMDADDEFHKAISPADVAMDEPPAERPDPTDQTGKKSRGDEDKPEEQPVEAKTGGDDSDNWDDDEEWD